MRPLSELIVPRKDVADLVAAIDAESDIVPVRGAE
jgi:hypothetical protein